MKNLAAAILLTAIMGCAAVSPRLPLGPIEAYAEFVAQSFAGCAQLVGVGASNYACFEDMKERSKPYYEKAKEEATDNPTVAKQLESFKDFWDKESFKLGTTFDGLNSANRVRDEAEKLNTVAKDAGLQ